VPRSFAGAISCAITIAALLVAAEDHAEARDFTFFLPIGGGAGYAINPKALPSGGYISGEASFVGLHKEKVVWVGGYADVTRDLGSKTTRFTVGPEVGAWIFGLDGGWVVSNLDGLHHGVCGRFLLSFAFVHAYARVGHIFDSPQEGTYGEVGGMIKLPIPILLGGDAPPRPPAREPPPPPLPVAAPPSPEDPREERGDPSAPDLPVATPPSDVPPDPAR